MSCDGPHVCNATSISFLQKRFRRWTAQHLRYFVQRNFGTVPTPGTPRKTAMGQGDLQTLPRVFTTQPWSGYRAPNFGSPLSSKSKGNKKFMRLILCFWTYTKFIFWFPLFHKSIICKCDWTWAWNCEGRKCPKTSNLFNTPIFKTGLQSLARAPFLGH